MKKLFGKYARAVVISLIVIMGIILIVTAVSMLVQYTDEVADQAVSKAMYNTLSVKQDVENAIRDCETRAVIVASTVAKMTTHEEIYDYLFNLNRTDTFSDVLLVRYYIDDTLYDSTGNEYHDVDPSRAIHKERPKYPRFTGTYEDSTTVDGGMSVIGFYSPVSDTSLIDAVVVYYTRNKVENFFSPKNKNTDAEFSVLCSSSGEVIVGMNVVESSQIFNVLRSKFGDKAPVDGVQKLMQQATDGTVIANIGNDDYLVSVGAESIRMRDLCVVELYSVDLLCASNFEFIHTVIAIFIFFAILAAIVVAYLAIHRAILKREFSNLETVDKQLGCLNRHGFEKEAKHILERNTNSYFAIIVFELRHYKHIEENFGESEAENLLRYLKTISSKTVQIEELFGHVEEGQFLLLLHAKDREDLLERLKLHASLSSRYKGANSFDVNLKYGIYETDMNENVTVSQMIDFANEANNAVVRATVQNATMRFNFYNDDLRKIRLINEDMELRMEGALQNGEFQVFYQPKYNLRMDKQDGAEALVRWYDKQTNQYNRPALFMQLFETNGFIVKLDKYVYTKVCEYISYSIAQGRKVYPVSVNVSRVTAVQPDFIDYFVKTKKRFGIADGQIMVEFTESFAYENYETLSVITEALHKNGFKCSIDDFGSGYSSYKILKELPMDEIKLDKFFIEKGMSDERDLHIIESIISVGKKLGMKVTQEGVETEEDVKRLRSLGCDVIQGYFYAHPLPLSDYITFVASTREHDLN